MDLERQLVVDQHPRASSDKLLQDSDPLQLQFQDFAELRSLFRVTAMGFVQHVLLPQIRRSSYNRFSHAASHCPSHRPKPRASSTKIHYWCSHDPFTLAQIVAEVMRTMVTM